MNTLHSSTPDDGPELAAAAALAPVRFDGRLASLPAGWVPTTLDSAYRVQQQVRVLRGQTVAAYKLGMTSAAAQQANGLSEPIVGWLDSASVLPDGAALADARSRFRWVEAEVIFRMASDVPVLQPETAREVVAQAIGSAHAGIEVCDSRFLDCDAQPPLSVVADNSNASVIIIGGELPRLPPPLEVTLACGSVPLVNGDTSRVLGDPLVALCWLAAWLQQRGETLRAGQFVATGSCTGVTEAGPDDRCEVRFGDLATVECRFVP